MTLQECRERLKPAFPIRALKILSHWHAFILTSVTGKFVYIDASAPRIPGDVAKLSTPPFMSTGHCLTYWYYMYERDVASLKTLIKYVSITGPITD